MDGPVRVPGVGLQKRDPATRILRRWSLSLPPTPAKLLADSSGGEGARQIGGRAGHGQDIRDT